MTAPRGGRVLGTLRGRILVGMLGLLAVGLVGNAVAGALTLQGLLHERTELAVQKSGDRVRSAIADGVGVYNASALAANVSPFLGIMIVGVDGDIVFQVGDAAPTAVDRLTADRPDQLVHLGPSDGVRELLARRIPTHGARVRTASGDVAPTSAFILTMAPDLERTTVEAYVVRQAVVVAVTLLLAGATALLVLRFGLRPLGRMADAAGAIASGARDERLPTFGDRSETDRLAIAVNQAFDAQVRAENNVRNFAADASHELRTPLATISGWLDLYHQGGITDPAELDRVAERLDAEVGRMRLLVEELSLLARLDAGRPLAADRVDLRDLATDIVDDARVVAPDHTVRLEAGAPVPVRGDEPRLRQVLHNLVGNAVQHTPPGTTVDVALADAGGSAVLRVVDDGPGIAGDDLSHVFDRFWRADAGRNRDRGNSGLGLAIVQAVVHAHRGTVEVTSPVGGGTVVTVRLPALAVSRDA